MLEALLWIVVGALIGWNFPQPAWAWKLQQKLRDLISK
jgi:hypothetical protein